MDILVTNNPLVQEQYQSTFRVAFLDTDLFGILIHVRDMVHKGYILKTHPLTGSIKPNESPYKSIIISGKRAEIDTQSVGIIGDCIEVLKKFPPKNFNKKYKHDMQIIDLSFIQATQGN